MTAAERLNTCGGHRRWQQGDDLWLHVWATPGASEPVATADEAHNTITRCLTTAGEVLRADAIIDAMAAWCLDPSPERCDAAWA